MKKITLLLSISLVSTVLSQYALGAAQVKAGAKCAKVNSTQIIGSKKFTCIKSGSKLIWNNGITIAKSANPMPSPTQIVVAPMPNESNSPAATLVKFKNCTEAKAAGVAPLNKALNPDLYEINSGLDRDKDGIACES